jgi:hypothetical protein
VKGLKAGVISILAIGLVAGSAVGVAAQDEAADPMAPSTFTGEFTGTAEDSTDPATGLEVSVSPWEATDPRASGTWTGAEDAAVLDGDDGQQFTVGREAVRLANDGGAWVGTKRWFLALSLPDGPVSVGTFTELVGEGGYEGLSLFMFETFDGDFEDGPDSISTAFIVPTDMVPAMPPPPSAE